ncbi:PREDICTED: dimethyladenosine transferase 2, mitochondrial-like isoform X2 [Branchiostoma belcheri]|uniref:rRNA adenine N(6)-methyltransferase n=1 Tax=Branchiostoma belcheri TaxID=7741 RepID=A0A6P4Z8T6_BRABE|nr:PREDICTED: dimethyladenosine transferase 2, mitochondrial-like isoform X2 [Branchiostoma belcheri]
MWLCVSRCPLLVQLHLSRQQVAYRSFLVASQHLQGNRLHIRSLNCHVWNSGVRWWCSTAWSAEITSRNVLLCSVGQRKHLRQHRLPARTLVSSGQQLPSLPSTEELLKKHGCLRRAFKSRIKNKYILDQALAAVVVDHLGDLSENKQWIFELNPGPGVVTRELLAAGASRILILENDRVFLPYSMALAKHVGERVHVKYADFFRIDPMGDGIVKQPAISSVELFNNVQPAHWREEVIVRVVGMLSQEKEKTHLRHLCYRVLERSSLFEYGRMELNLFITEKVYNMITAPAGVDLVAYESTAILCQVCFDIQLLLKEPNSRFLPVQVKGQTNYKHKANADRFVNDHMCLVRLTPKDGLFDHGLTPQNGSQFIFLVRQLMAKPRAKLADRMEIWVPGSLDILSDLGLRPDMRAGDLSPPQFMKLFLLLLQNGSFHNTWWEEEAYEQIHSINNRTAA